MLIMPERSHRARTPVVHLLLLGVALFSLVAFTPVQAVKVHDFKTCSQSGFCRRNRALADRAASSDSPHPWTSPYHVVGDPIFEKGTIKADIGNYVYGGIKYELKVEFLDAKAAREDEGIVRIRMDEIGERYGGWKRYDEASRWALENEPRVLEDGSVFQVEIGSSVDKKLGGGKVTSVKFGNGATDEFRLFHDPIKVEVLRGGQTHLVLNERGLLNLEHFRPKSEPASEGGDAPDMLVQDGSGQENLSDVLTGSKEDGGRWAMWKDENEDGFWEESFGGNTDSKPKGPESLSLDITFPGYEHVYGIPEHASPLSLKTTRGGEGGYTDPYRLYNLDVFEYEFDSPMSLYGAIPFMHAHRAGSTIGVFWLNGAETWIDVEKKETSKEVLEQWKKSKKGKGVEDEGPVGTTTTTHWISESGVLDLFVILPTTKSSSPSSDSTNSLTSSNSAVSLLQLYTSLTGTTILPPMFSIAHHQCRWNYLSEDDVLGVSQKFDEFDIPMDVIWLDIEYAEEHKYFIWDRRNFPNPEKMQEGLADRGRKLVAIVDPHIKRVDSLYVYKEAQDLDVLSKKADGKTEYEGWCWTGSSAWVDFFNPKSWNWWIGLFKFNKFLGSTPYLNVWVDMNEPSIFNGPEITMPKDNIHHGGWEHRDLHNINGMVYHNLTTQALIKREEPARRPFTLSRSYFAGSQRYGAVWTGDNLGTWEHMAVSVPMILSNGVGGVAWSGADVGGFFGNPSPEMLVRWYQAGAFAPFFRAHAHIDTKRREPYLYDEPIRGHLRDAIRLRYSLLPVWYTAFWEASVRGTPIARPQYFVFPRDSAGFSVDDQYFIGSSGLLVKPVVAEGVTEAEVYLADPEPYYNYFTHDVYFGKQGGLRVKIPAPLDTIPLFHRGGSILPRRDLVRRSAPLMWRDPISLVVALDSTGSSAKGELYLDDAESYAYERGEFVWRGFEVAPGDGKNIVLRNVDLVSQISADRLSKDYQKGLTSYNPSTNGWAKKIEPVKVEKVVVLGLAAKPSCVRLRGASEGLDFTWSEGVSATSGKKATAGKAASRLVVSSTGEKLVDDWELVFEYGTSKCASTSVPDPFSAVESPECPTGQFLCKNPGHISSCILLSRVNDGICDPECCDGSDEFDGKLSCPNRCKEVGAEHRKKVEEEGRKTRVGAKLRSEYISFGAKAKRNIEANIERMKEQLHGLEERERKLKQLLENTEIREAGEIERKKSTKLYSRLVDYQAAIRQLRKKQSTLDAQLGDLSAILTDLKSGYNPNYQDMAVKHSVQRFEEWQKAHGLSAEDARDETADETTGAEAQTEEEDTEFPEAELNELEGEDPLSLMESGGERRVGSGTDESGLLFRIEEYLPSSIKPGFEQLRNALLNILVQTGIIHKSAVPADASEHPDVSRARTAFQAMEAEVSELRNKMRVQDDILGKDWGREWEWKKLENECVEKDMGEYTYKLCFFGEGHQKANVGYQNTLLGKFGTWNPNATPGTDEYYRKQVYDQGARCWNGPERSIKADLVCGTKNELLSVIEPEKCEYLFKISTPAVCFPGSESKAPTGTKEEL